MRKNVMKKCVAMTLSVAMFVQPILVHAEGKTAESQTEVAEEGTDSLLSEPEEDGTGETSEIVGDIQESTEDIQEHAEDSQAGQEGDAGHDEAEGILKQAGDSAVLETASDFTYDVLNGTYCSITGYNGSESEMVIPTEMDGYIVQAISANAFSGNLVIQKAVFPDSIEKIGTGIFQNCTELKYVSLNSGLTNISANAFSGCTGLEGIALPSGIETIDANAFSGCTGLTEVSMSDSVTGISGRAFYNCTNLSKVELSSNWKTTSVGSSYGYDSPFAGCSKLKEISLPSGMTKVPAYAFKDCKTLETVKFNGEAEEIGSNAFSGCTGLKTVALNKGIKIIGSSAFRYCSGLSEMELPETLETIDTYAFSECTEMTEIVLPEMLDTINSYAFNGCKGLAKITIPEAVHKLNSYVFLNCSGLSEIELPKNLETIDFYAFSGCSGLESIEIPDSVTGISGRAFNNCTNLSNVKLSLNWGTTNVGSSYGYDSPFVGCTKLKEISLPSGMTKVPAYAFEDCKALETVKFNGEAEEIGNDAFSGCTALRTVTLNKGIKAIGNSAFRYCSGLAEIELPETLETIGSYAFSGCTGLTKVTIPETVHKLKSYAFSDCKGLLEIGLPKTLETVDAYAFSGCAGLTRVIIPEAVHKLNNNVFSGCTGLTEIELPKTLEEIDYYAFHGCSGLESIEIPDSVTGISGRAFNNCTNLSKVELSSNWKTTNVGSSYGYDSPFVGCSKLKEISLPSGMTKVPSYAFEDCKTLETVNFNGEAEEIGNDAFSGCTGLRTVTLNKGIKTIGSSAFRDCSGLTEVGLPETLETINSYAFSNCTGLSKVTLPEGVHQLNSYVFADCSGLKEIGLPETLETIDYYAFGGCSGLKKIEIPDSVTEISGRAFNNCTNLSRVKLPANWQTISVGNVSRSDSPFVGCSKLKEISLPSGLAKVPNYAFKDCTALKSVTVSDGTTEIGYAAFNGCTSLEEIWIPDTVTAINQNTFSNCTSLVIHGVSGSYAEQYATENNIAFSTDRMEQETITISGYVTDQKGSGIEKVAVALYDEDKKMLSDEEIYTDQDGHWSFDQAVLNHKYSVYFEKTKYSIEPIRHWLITEEDKDAGKVIADVVGADGESKAEDFQYKILNGTYCSITGYTGSDSEVTLPSKIDGYIVQKISSNAFANNKTIEKVFFSSTIESMESGVFQNCTALNYVALNTGLKKIESNAFAGCTNLQKVVFPISLQAIDYYAFSGCSGLESIEIPDTVTGISGRAFYNCTNLSKVELSSNWQTTNVGSSYGYDSPFVGCTKLKEISLPSGMTKIPAYAFEDCKALETVNFNGEAEEIGNDAFSGCTGLRTVTLNKGIKTIGSSAFRYCSGLTELGLPETLETINSYAFSNCTGLPKVTLPEGVRQINSYVFADCSGLTEVELPETLESIDYYAFGGCSGLKKIEIPDSVTGISGRAFNNCTNLSRVKLPANWQTISVGNASRSDSPFLGCSKLKEISLPSGLAKVPNYAFKDCTALKSVTVSDGTTEIGYAAFNGCTSLEEIWISDTVTAINQNTFSNCTSLVIHGVSGSYAEQYATENNIAFSTDRMEQETITISGCVTDQEGTGLEKVSVALYDEDKNTVIDEEIYTDQEGRWSYEQAVLNHKYSVYFEKTKYSIEPIKHWLITEADKDAGKVIADVVGTDGENKVEDFQYKVLNGTYCSITGYTGNDSEVTLPSKIDGYIVQKISSNAFADNKTIEKVFFPSTIESMESGSFRNCTALNYVALNMGLKKIENNAFSGCTNLQKVVFPISLQAIDYYAFHGCSGLESIEIPDSVTGISGRAFNNCTNLSKVELSSNWKTTNVGSSYGYDSPFVGCTKLKEISLPSGMTKVPAYAFEDCKALETLEFNSEAEEIGNDAFSGCTGLRTVTLNKGIKTIGSSAFRDCSGLTELGLPETLETINSYAFSNCTGLSKVTLPEGVRQLNSYAFSDCKGLTEIELPETLEMIELYAFSGCTGLTKVTIPGAIHKINSYVFSGCTSLTEVKLPETLETIDYYAFNGCGGLESIEIPDTVTGISGRAFYNCTNLSKVELSSNWKTTNVGSSYGYDSPFVGCTKLKEINLPSGMTKVPAYAFEDCKALETVNFNDEAEEIGNDAFSGCTSLRAVTLNKRIKTIGNSAFKYCSGLTEIGLPETLETIGSYAFSGCTGLTKVTLPEGVRQLNSYAFSNCIGLTEVKLPETLETIDVYAFSGCAGLTKVTIPEAVQKINSSVFNGCTSLAEIKLPETLETIDYYAFNGCSGLESIEIPDSVTGISGRAFYNCTNLSKAALSSNWKTTNVGSSYGYDSPFVGCSKLKEISLPSGMTKVPSYAFEECKTLETVNFGDKVEEVGVYAFSGCTGLKSLDLNEEIKVLGSNAFYGCTGLKNVTIPENVYQLDNNVFGECKGLTTIVLPESLKTIGMYAFGNCAGLTKIEIPDSVTEISGYAFANCINLSKVKLSANWGTVSGNTSPFMGCSKLKELSLPEGTEKIPAYAFKGCSKLHSVACPETLKTIERNAFENCSVLEKVELIIPAINIAANAFSNDSHLIVYTVETSNVVKYCMENNINFVIIRDEEGNPDNGVLDKEKCVFDIEERSIINNTVKFKLKYSIKDVQNLENKTIEIITPKLSELFVNNVSIDGEISKSYEYNKAANTLTIPVTEAQGEISYSVKISSSVAITSYASLEYETGGEKKSETLGVVSSADGMVSAVVDNRISEKKFKVSGVAPAESDVRIYMDDELKTTVKATKLGVYEAQLTIEDPRCFRTYTIKSAVTLKDNSIVSSEATTTYNDETPKLKGFTLYHRNLTVDLMKLEGKRPIISFSPSYPMTFVARFDNRENINKVYITSTRNNEVKRLEATYDSKKGQYIASGWFDENNHSYVPGALSINYIVNDVEYDYSPDTYFEDKENIESLPEEYKNADIEVIKNTEDEAAYRVKLDTDQSTDQDIEYYQAFKQSDLGFQADDNYAQSNGYYSVKDNSGTEYYIKSADLTSDKIKQIFGDPKKEIKGQVISFIKKHDSTLVELYFDEDVAKAYDYLKETVYKPASKYMGVFKTIRTAAQKQGDIEDIQWKIRSDTTLTEKERARKNGLCNLAILLNGISCIGKVSVVAYTAMGALAGPWGLAIGLILGACDYIVDEYAKGLQGGYAFEKFYNAFAWLNWIVDPSGYVYEAVPDNYLEGVTATIYYKDNETGEAVQWDAEEYDQMNPLKTDENGVYAWDVPEGLYQVKYEKEGYETAYSEWLPVPPPQTDVNISMVSKQAPEVESVLVNPEEITLAFTQYMKADTINSEMVTLKENGTQISYEVTAVDAEKLNGQALAKVYKLVPVKRLSGKITVNCKSEVCNYAGNSLKEAYSCTKTVEKKITDIKVKEAYSFGLDKKGTIKVSASPKSAVAGKKLLLSLSNEYTLSLDSQSVTFDENGEAEILLETLLPGQVELSMEIEGTMLTRTAVINCVMTNDDAVQDTSRLETVIKTEESLKKSDYTVETWEVMQKKLVEAKDALEAKESQRVVDEAADSLESAIAELVKVVVPGKASSVSATVSGTDKVKVTWKAGKDAKGYYVLRSTDKAILKAAATANDSELKSWATKYASKNAAYKKTTALSYTDTVKTGKTYYYLVVSYSKDGVRNAYSASDIKGVNVPATYKVTFSKNGGSTVSSTSKTVVSGKTYGTLPTATRKGYTLKGWYTAKTGGKKVASSTKVALKANQTLYAQWTKVSAPAKVAAPTVKNASSKKMTVSYKKVSGAAGYAVTYATNAKFTGSKTVTTTSLSKTISGLQKGKTYYVKVRAYKLDSQKNKVYGSYSTVKSVKINK